MSGDGYELLPEPFSDALSALAHQLRLLDEPLTDEIVVRVWIAGLIAGTALKVEHGKEWIKTAKGGYPGDLPYAIRFPCPFRHRRADRRGRAWVQLVIEENAWWSLDPESACTQCTATEIERWLLTCPRCATGEDSERHPALHAVLGVGDLFDADSSPLMHVIAEFDRLREVANARWWVERYDEAVADLGARADRTVFDPEHGAMRAADWKLMKAREALGVLPRNRAIASVRGSKAQDVDDVAAWLDQHNVPDEATVRGAWTLVKDIPGRPPKNAIEEALKVRKQRGTAT